METNRSSLRIAVIGDINVDLSFSLPLFPCEGDDTPVTALRWGSGGGGLNMAVALARLGAQARLIGRVGTDLAAGVALHVARQAGVELSLLQTDPQLPTGLCGVMVSPGGQRSFLSFRGANVCCDPEVIGRSALAESALVLISGYALLAPPQQVTALRAVDLAVELGIPCALDLCLPAIRSVPDIIAATIPKLWLLTLNEDELHALLPDQRFAQGLNSLVAMGAQIVAIKQGAQGCCVADRTTRVDSSPPAPIAVIDTNGCGDAFTAGFIWAMLLGCSVHDCAALANHMGGLTATRPGAADAIPSHEEIYRTLDPHICAKLTH